MFSQQKQLLFSNVKNVSEIIFLKHDIYVSGIFLRLFSRKAKNLRISFASPGWGNWLCEAWERKENKQSRVFFCTARTNAAHTLWTEGAMLQREATSHVARVWCFGADVECEKCDILWRGSWYKVSRVLFGLMTQRELNFFLQWIIIIFPPFGIFNVKQVTVVYVAKIMYWIIFRLWVIQVKIMWFAMEEYVIVKQGSEKNTIAKHSS